MHGMALAQRHNLWNDDYLHKLPLHKLYALSHFSPFRTGKQLGQLKQSYGKKLLQDFRCCVQPLPYSFSKGKVLQAGTMDEIYDTLAKRLMSAIAATPPSSKYFVGLAGPPGAGKSTVSKEVTKRVNELWLQANSSSEGDNGTIQNDVAVALPMDGFHLYRRQLDMMEDPAEAHARRGAPWTFDPDGLLQCLATLQNQGWVLAPSFDHGVGDPKENDIIVTRSHRVIVVEGNYLLLSDDKWKAVMDIFDERWYLDVDMETTLDRVVERFVVLGKPPEQVKAQVDYNDRKNAEIILTSKVNADIIIKSVDLP